MIRYDIGDNLSIIHIQYWRQVSLMVVYLYLRNISAPLLIWLVCMEVPVDDIGSDFPDFTLIGLIFGGLFPLRIQHHLVHQFFDGIVVDGYAIIMQLNGDAPVAVSAIMPVVDTIDFLAEAIVPIRLTKPLDVVIECSSCHPLEL